jgi:hypothetical protein
MERCVGRIREIGECLLDPALSEAQPSAASDQQTALPHLRPCLDGAFGVEQRIGFVELCSLDERVDQKREHVGVAYSPALRKPTVPRANRASASASITLPRRSAAWLRNAAASATPGSDPVSSASRDDPLNSLSPEPLLCAGEWFAEQPLRQWGVQEVEDPLQSDLAAAATAFDWHLIDRIRQAFQGHGVCATGANRWVNSWSDAYFTYKHLDGTWHPNAIGQDQIADSIYAAISPGLQ